MSEWEPTMRLRFVVRQVLSRDVDEEPIIWKRILQQQWRARTLDYRIPLDAWEYEWRDVEVEDE